MSATTIIQISTSGFAEKDARPLTRLREAGFEVRLNPYKRKLTIAESQALLADVLGLIAGVELLNDEVLAAAPKLKVISRVGTGMDAVDQQAAAARGIQVFNTPDSHIDAVAELALAGLLNGLRGQIPSDRAIRAGLWERSMGRLLRGKTVGVVGMGKVGKALIQLLQPFKVVVLAYDPYWDEAFAAQFQVQRVSLEQLLTNADAVSLHVPGSKGLALIGAPELALLKPDAVLVNTARGGLVDELALIEHLGRNPRGVAVLDVFSEEPYGGPLAALPNALFSAHVGAYAEECRVDMEMQAVENLINALKLTAALSGKPHAT